MGLTDTLASGPQVSAPIGLLVGFAAIMIGYFVARFGIRQYRQGGAADDFGVFTRPYWFNILWGIGVLAVGVLTVIFTVPRFL